MGAVGKWLDVFVGSQGIFAPEHQGVSGLVSRGYLGKGYDLGVESGDCSGEKLFAPTCLLFACSPATTQCFLAIDLNYLAFD